MAATLSEVQYLCPKVLEAKSYLQDVSNMTLYRDTVMRMLREMDPEGVHQRARRRFC